MHYIKLMSRQTQAIQSLHPKVRDRIKTVGSNITVARKRRGMTKVSLAELALVSRNTVTRVEKGDPSVSIGVLASILNVLHLEDDLASLASPFTDEIGQIVEHKEGSGDFEDYDF